MIHTGTVNKVNNQQSKKGRVFTVERTVFTVEGTLFTLEQSVKLTTNT